MMPLYAPYASGLYGARLGVAARRMLVRTQIAALAYRNSHGSFPAALADLGAVPNDPFSKKPLHYRLTGEGFVLYSVGWNRKDDGGQSGTGPRRNDDPTVRFPARS